MNTPFEGWAVIEIMGHRQLAGFVREVDLFGSKMAQIDVPDLPAELARDQWSRDLPAVPAFTQFYGGAAIFSTTPTTEALARAAAVRFRSRPPITLDPSPAALGPVDDEDDSHMGGNDDDDRDPPSFEAGP